MRHITLILLLLLGTGLHAQNVGINATGAAPEASAMLDVSSTTAGMLTPRMTETQRTAIPAPATGLLVYQTDGQDGFWYFNGTVWLRLCTTPRTYQSHSTNGVLLTAIGTWFNMPGLSQTITVDEPSSVHITVGGGIQNTSAAANTFSIIDVIILQDGILVNGAYKRPVAANTTGLVTIIEHFSMTAIATVGPGTYTFSVAGSKQAGQNGTLFGDATSVLQGSMSIVVIPQ